MLDRVPQTPDPSALAARRFPRGSRAATGFSSFAIVSQPYRAASNGIAPPPANESSTIGGRRQICAKRGQPMDLASRLVVRRDRERAVVPVAVACGELDASSLAASIRARRRRGRRGSRARVTNHVVVARLVVELLLETAARTAARSSRATSSSDGHAGGVRQRPRRGSRSAAGAPTRRGGS